MSLLWSLLVGGALGAIAGAIMGKDVPGGIIGNIIAGLLGSWIGTYFLGAWGPEIGGFYILPALIGAVVLIFIVSFILGNTGKR